MKLVAQKIRLERGYARNVAKEFRTCGAIAADVFERNGEDDACAAIRERNSILRSILFRNSVRVADFFAASLRRHLESVTKAKRPTVTRTMIRFLEKHALARADQISRNTIKKVRQVIVDGVSKRHATSTIARAINKVIDNPARARAIARTEVHTAAQYAQDKEAEEFGVPMIREWSTAGDEAVRPTHAKADGQKRKIGQPFRVGGHLLMFPGDPSGPPEEVINCRCVVLYEPARSK